MKTLCLYNRYYSYTKRYSPYMKISFYIDDTLIAYGDGFATEEQSWYAKILGVEKLRLGTINLFEELRSRNHSIWLYTTSHRSKWKLWTNFRLHGFQIDGVINQCLNQKVLTAANCTASKNPKLFAIDIHVDDSRGVEIEGQRFGFNTIIVRREDKDWAEKVLNAILKVEEIKQGL